MKLLAPLQLLPDTSWFRSGVDTLRTDDKIQMNTTNNGGLLNVGAPGSTAAAQGLLVVDVNIYRSASSVLTIAAGVKAQRCDVNTGPTAAAGFLFGTTGASWRNSTGSPESVVQGYPGALWSRSDGTPDTTLYVKGSGTGSTGWLPVTLTDKWVDTTGDTMTGDLTVNARIIGSRTGNDLATENSFNYGGTYGLTAAGANNYTAVLASGLVSGAGFNHTGFVRGMQVLAGVAASFNGTQATSQALVGQIAAQGGTITAAAALTALGAFGAGAITNAYGLDLGAQKVAGVSNGYGIYQRGASDLNYFAGNVGVGIVADPSYRLWAYRTSSGLTGSNGQALRTGHDWNAAADASGYVVGAVVAVAATQATGTTYTNMAAAAINAITAQTTVNGDGTYNTSVGPFLSQITKNGTGTLLTARQYTADTPIVNAGTITNSYGIDIQAQKVTGVTNGYGIYQRGANDLNVFAGSISLGEGANVTVGSTTGTKFGTAATQKLAFWGNAAVARPTGWGAPTGTATRTTFATTTATLTQVAERLKALIDDLTLEGLIGA